MILLLLHPVISIDEKFAETIQCMSADKTHFFVHQMVKQGEWVLHNCALRLSSKAEKSRVGKIGEKEHLLGSL